MAALESSSILIIGAGFSGAMTAAHLLRTRAAKPVQVVLANRGALSARGVAYGTRTPAHVLNVPAGRMSAFPDDEDHFLRFAQTHDYSITGGSFVPRALYGQYLEFVLAEAERERAPGSELERRVGDVVDVTIGEDADHAEVLFADGECRRFDSVVLAIGNYPPADPRIENLAALGAPGYIRDPWAPRAVEKVDLGEPVLLLGTGLTTLDVSLDLHQRGMRAPMIALSRRGLLPLAHRPLTAAPSFAHRPPDIDAVVPTALQYLRSVRRTVRQVASEGVDWREVVAALRPITPELWARLPTVEQARFLRHLRPFWEVHRHRAAPLPHGMFLRLVSSGDLSVIAGRLNDLDPDATGFSARIMRRGSSEITRLHVGSVVNCTGPQSNILRLDEPLMRKLLQRGYVRADSLCHGLDTTEDLAVIDQNGGASRVLHYIGPLLRARYWEATAVPELRVHVARLTKYLARNLTAT